MTPDGPEPPRETSATLTRGLIMLLFIVAFSIAQTLLGLIALLQFLWLLIGGEANARVARFGRSLGGWLEQVAAFQSCASERRPFPWSDWPSAD